MMMVSDRMRRAYFHSCLGSVVELLEKFMISIGHFRRSGGQGGGTLNPKPSYCLGFLYSAHTPSSFCCFQSSAVLNEGGIDTLKPRAYRLGFRV